MVNSAPSAARIALACLILPAFPGRGAAAVTVQDLASRVREQVERLKSESAEERAAADQELVRLGRKAVPLLQPHLNDQDPEVKGRVVGTLRRIQNTDPFFLVRAPERKVSLDLVEASLDQVLEELRTAFPSWPPLSLRLQNELSSKKEKPIRMAVRDASFWPAVQAFSEATDAALDLDGTGNPRFEPKGKVEAGSSKMSGPFLLTARTAHEEGQVKIVLRLHPEPGCHPLYVRFALTGITDADGKSVTEKFERTDEPAGGERFMSGTRTLPRITLCTLRARKGNLSGIEKVRLQAKVTLDLARQIEGVEFRAEGFRGAQEKMISGCRVTLEEFVARPQLFSYGISFKGPREWEAPRAEPWKGSVWVFVANDAGHAINPSVAPYGGSSGQMIGAGWEFPSPPTRLSLIRPVEAESLEIPVDLGELSLQPGK